MTARSLLFVMILILAACSPTQEMSATPDIDAIVSATVSAQQEAFFQPILRAPVNGVTFANPASVILDWDWMRDLEEGEFFDVRVWREGEPAYGITWTSDSEYNLAQWLSQQAVGEYFWSIAVIQSDSTSGTVEATLGTAPEPRRFRIESTVLPTPTIDPTPEPFTVNDIIRRVPQNFTIEIAAQIEEAPTAITDLEFNTNGDLLALGIDGRIYRLIDSNDDGLFEEYEQILEEALDFGWAVGIALYEDRIYISDETRIGYVEDSDGDGIYESYTAIVEDLPGRIYPMHSNNGILIYNDLLYVAIGSTTDHGPISEEYEASILTMNLDGSNIEVFATGFRNPYDLAMSPDGRLFTADNSPDRLNQGLNFFPPEELNYVREGRHYGFPDVYGNDYRIANIDYETENPVTEFTTSTATSGLVYYAETQFPEEYQDGVFVAQFGGMMPGRIIAFVPLEETEDGNYTGDWQTFLQLNEGFEPVDLVVGLDGSLYIMEWSHGYLLRVTYTG